MQLLKRQCLDYNCLQTFLQSLADESGMERAVKFYPDLGNF